MSFGRWLRFGRNTSGESQEWSMLCGVRRWTATSGRRRLPDAGKTRPEVAFHLKPARKLGLLIGLLLGSLVLAATSTAASWLPLPSLVGDISGELAIFGETGPRLQWRVETLTPASAATRHARLSIDGLATHAVATVELDARTGDGAWRIDDARFDVGAWLQSLADRLPAEAQGVLAEGTLTLSGAGEIRDGRPVGRVAFAWREGVVRDAGRGVTLGGVSVQGEADVATLPDGAVPIELGVGTIKTSRFGARNLVVHAALNGLRELVVSAARIEIAGGKMEADPFVMALAPPALNVKVRVTRIGLQDVVALVPSGLADARGRVDGEIWLGWSEAGGIQVGEGRLVLHANEPATVRLAATPGFLTSRVPDRIMFLPERWGRLARKLSLRNPAHEDLGEIELGRTDLRVEAFEARITPEGDSEGRSAHVTVLARPTDPENVVEEVTFEINVAGPIADVLRIGVNQPFSFEMK